MGKEQLCLSTIRKSNQRIGMWFENSVDVDQIEKTARVYKKVYIDEGSRINIYLDKCFHTTKFTIDDFWMLDDI